MQKIYILVAYWSSEYNDLAEQIVLCSLSKDKLIKEKIRLESIENTETFSERYEKIADFHADLWKGKKYNSIEVDEKIDKFIKDNFSDYYELYKKFNVDWNESIDFSIQESDFV